METPLSTFPWWRIGWRNLRRNHRRTLITALGLAISYFAVVFLVGWADGIKSEMVENGTGILTGQIQVHALDYRPERSLYQTIGGRNGTDVARMLQILISDDSVSAVAPRVYAGGLVSSGESTSAGILMGIDPKLEPKVSRILTGIVSGRAVKVGANEILVGTEMAQQLEIQLSDEIVVVAPAADGSIGNDLFTVTGIFHTGMSELDSSYTVVPMDALQKMVALAPGRIHEIAITTTNPWLAPQASERLAQNLGIIDIQIEVAPWTVLAPAMFEYTRLVESYYFIVIFIVFAIAIFGVTNTMLMATFERRREIAVMLALGTTPSQVILAILAEGVALGLLSLVVAAAITFPIITWCHYAPIDLSQLYNDITMFGALVRPQLRVEYNLPVSIWAGVALQLTALLAAFYPAMKAARVPPADTLSDI